MTNRQKIKGVWNEAVGETKERIGRALGNEKIEAKGRNQELKGKVQQAVGSIKETGSKIKNNLKEGYDNMRTAAK